MKRLNIYTLRQPNNYVWLFVVYILFATNLWSQTKDTGAYQLQEVPIIHTKQELIETSKKTISIDSLTLARYSTTSLADLLAGQSTIHIKSYGNGNIATTSMRGGNANHTALLWNGLMVQNAMLGQQDLSIIPTLFFDNVSLEYGGGSAMWGSGAIGGSIHLQNKPGFNQGFKTKLQMSVGSFGTRKIGTGVLLSYKKVVSNTKVYYTSSENNYSYKDTVDKEKPNKQLTHSDYIAKGVLQEISFLASPYQKVNVRLWYNTMDRNLPSYAAYISKKSQEDKNLKLNADWNYSKNKLNSTIRLGYFNDKLNYTDSLANTFSKTSINTFIGESDNMYTHKNHKFNFGINYTQYNSTLIEKIKKTLPQDLSSLFINNHLSIPLFDTIILHNLNKFALFAAYNLSLFDSKLHYNFAIRKEFTNQTTIPFTGNTGIHYQLTKLIAAKINANKSFRQPTLNDLYWSPGGNPNLKPEDSYEVDGGIELNYKKGDFTVLLEGSYFNRHTKNWIIWLPTPNGYPTPKNITEIYSRGTETKTELAFSKKDILLKLIINTSYVLSTYQKPSGENDNSVGRQLIFTPRYTGQGSVLMRYKNLNILLNNNYTGYRFTSSDNSSWLYPYYIANLKCSYSYSFSTIHMELFCSINNLFNKNYVVVQNMPMPLRNYEAGLSMNYYKPKKKNESLLPIN
ncbi:MAG: TonB-dependent receptor [Bacteroidetes bacterium]|nr:TonB-dependent receptor [Bacteroidota bacterium]